MKKSKSLTTQAEPHGPKRKEPTKGVARVGSSDLLGVREEVTSARRCAYGD